MKKPTLADELNGADTRMTPYDTQEAVRSGELSILNRQLKSKNEENEKSAAALAVANIELLHQNEERGKRAAELAIANVELLFQNEEKEKRAAELAIANEELLFQNNEKAKRAAELAVANEELLFQNALKETRARELMSANSNLVRAEEKLIEANNELESFSYSVAHDLRAPLRAISGYSKMLKVRFSDQLDAEGNRLMNNIMNNAVKMGQLIDDLLRFSRVGRMELKMMFIPMQELVASLCKDFKDEQNGRQIEIHIHPLLSVRADPFTIKQVWYNLISNAIKYTRDREIAVIEIGSRHVGNEIIYYVSDNGAGFDMRYADKLFGVFQRLHSEEEFDGTGVGLALVQRIVHKHGGRVWGNGKINQGAAFYFTLKTD